MNARNLSQNRLRSGTFMVLMVMLITIGNSFGTPIAGADSSTCESLDPIEGTGRSDLAAGLELLVQTVSACKSAADFETMSAMVTEDYLGQVYGGGPTMTRPEFLALSVGIANPAIRFRDFDDLVRIDDGEARANVKLIVGSQLTFERLFFVEEEEDPGVWLIDRVESLRVTPPRDHVVLDVAIAGNFYDPAVLSAAGATVNIRVANNDIEDHELLILQLPIGASTGAILIETGPGLPIGFVYLAQVTIPAGKSGNLVLVGMKPGAYSIVDLLPSANGVPHLALGMQATLTITE